MKDANEECECPVCKSDCGEVIVVIYDYQLIACCDCGAVYVHLIDEPQK